MFRNFTIDKYTIFYSCKQLYLCFCNIRYFIYFSNIEDSKQNKVQIYIKLSKTNI